MTASGRGSWTGLILCMMGFLSCEVGCTERDNKGPAEAGPARTEEPRLPSTGAYVFSGAGEQDRENRYASVVMVSARIATPEGLLHQECAGVLIGPRLVLTAGHCLCVPKEEPGRGDGSIIDGSRCASEAAVMTFTYEPPKPPKGSRTVSDEYRGESRIHPRLKVVLDGNDHVVSSRADLAVVFLETPVEGDFPPMEPGRTRVGVDTPLVLVGYSYDSIHGALDGRRRFSGSKVTGLSEQGDKMFLSQEERERGHEGENGGPCLIESGQGPVLVGILSSRGVRPPSCTSLHAHQDWLSVEIERAARGDAPVPSSSRDGSVP